MRLSAYVYVIFISTLIFGSFIGSLPLLLYDEPYYLSTGYSAFTLIKTHLLGAAFPAGGLLFFLFPFLLKFWGSLFQFDFLFCRFFSVLLGVCSGCYFYALLSRLVHSLFMRWILLIGFITANTTFIVFRIIRPEALLLSLFVIFCYYLLVYFQTFSIYSIVFVGLLIPLVGFTNGTGLILGFILFSLIFLALLCDRKTKPFFIFLLSTVFMNCIIIISMSVYLSMTPIEMASSLLSSGRTSFIAPINWAIFSNHYVMGYYRLYIVVFEFSVLFIGLYLLRRSLFKLIFPLSTLLYFFTSFLFIVPFWRFYYVIIPAGTLITFALLIHHYLHRFSFSFRRGIFICLLFYVLNHLAGDVYLVQKHLTKASFSDIQKFLNIHISKNHTILASHYFLPFFIHQPFFVSYDALAPSDFSPFVVGVTTTRSMSISSTDQRPFAHFKASNDVNQSFVDTNKSVLASKAFPGYGTISIWKIMPPPVSR